MWKVVIESEIGDRTDVVLRHDVYAFGRAEGNQVRLTERNVSRRHARLVRHGPSFVLEDLGSYNGTFVNAQPAVGAVLLCAGDLVQIADYRLLIQHEVTQPPLAPQAPPSSSSTWGLPRLVMLVGPTPLADFPLAKPHMLIGRQEAADIRVAHESISRRHCELFALEGGRFEAVDLGSANGIRVNGARLQRAILDAGDVLVLGEDIALKYVAAGDNFRPGPNDLRALASPLALWWRALPYFVFVTIVTLGGYFAWILGSR